MNSSQQTKELIQSGKKYFESKNYARAQNYFLKVLRTGTRYADVLNLLGVVYHIEGRFNDAIKSFEEALDINPDYIEASLNLAVLYNDLGEYKKAKELFARVRKKKPVSRLDAVMSGKIANMHAEIGDTYRGIGKYVEAIDEYKMALKLCPTFADIRTKLGMAYRENNQRDLSIKEFSDVIRQSPKFNAAYLQLGISYYSAGQKDKAEKTWRDLLKKDDKNEIARMYLRLCENGNSSGK